VELQPPGGQVSHLMAQRGPERDQLARLVTGGKGVQRTHSDLRYRHRTTLLDVLHARPDPWRWFSLESYRRPHQPRRPPHPPPARRTGGRHDGRRAGRPVAAGVPVVRGRMPGSCGARYHGYTTSGVRFDKDHYIELDFHTDFSHTGGDRSVLTTVEADRPGVEQVGVGVPVRLRSHDLLEV